MTEEKERALDRVMEAWKEQLDNPKNPIHQAIENYLNPTATTFIFKDKCVYEVTHRQTGDVYTVIAYDRMYHLVALDGTVWSYWEAQSFIRRGDWSMPVLVK